MPGRTPGRKVTITPRTTTAPRQSSNTLSASAVQAASPNAFAADPRTSARIAASIDQMADNLGVPRSTPYQVVIEAATERINLGPKVTGVMDTLRQSLGLPKTTPMTEVLEASRVNKVREMGLPASTSLAEVLAEQQRRDDGTYDQQLAAAAARPGTEVPPPRRGAPGRQVLGWAQVTGRIAAAQRPQWDAAYERDPAGTEASVRILAATPAPARLSGTGLAASQTASGLDVSSLPPRLQAAAAREGDRAKVYMWIERYSGLSDAEVAPDTLAFEAFANPAIAALAAGVARDDADREAEAQRAQSAAFKEAQAAWSLKQANEHYEKHFGPNAVPGGFGLDQLQVDSVQPGPSIQPL